jgi:hypothetical protein
MCFVKIDDVLDKYIADIILLGEKEADKRLMMDLQIGIHADAFFEIIKMAYDEYKKQARVNPDRKTWN